MTEPRRPGAGEGSGSGHRSRYGRYTGGDPLAPPVDLREALAAIGEEVMAGYDPERALREHLRRGGRDRRGLDELARRVAERRREILKNSSLDGTLQQVKELLDQAVLAERGQLARDVDMGDDDRALRQMQLDELPPGTAAAVAALAGYDWSSSDARAAYEQIKDLLGREMLDQRFEGMKEALEGASEEDKARVAQMLTDLNELLDKHRRGEDTPQDFADFMAEHGDFFPEQPADIDELLDALAARAAAGARMMASMTAEQRAELAELSMQAFGSPALDEALAGLEDNLRALRPGEDWSGSERFSGDEGLGLGDGTGALQDLADLDSLADQLAQSYDGASAADIDPDLLERQLGPEAAVDARTLTDVERALRESGYLQRGADGQVTLSPRAIRELGKALLRDVASRMSGRLGQHEVRSAGAAGEPSGATRAWEFGDTAPWDTSRTISNAVLRQSGSGRRGSPVRIGVGDIEVQETEARTRAAVALCVDTSFSMAMEGRWVPMKRTALALHHLVSSRFRGDALQLIGFGRYAQQMDIAELTALDSFPEQGTNLHHALLLANRHFRRHAQAQPVLLVVTDGEPTAHLEPDGEALFSYPPEPGTIVRTVHELDSASRLGARVTFFRLGEDPALARFVDRMARRADGNVVAPDLDDLGAAVVSSYLQGRPGSGDDDLLGRWGTWAG